MCRKMWMRMWELELQWHPPFYYSTIHTSALPCWRLEPGAHVISWLDRPRSIPMPFTHIHTWHVHAHLPIPCPPLPWIACLDTYSVAHAHVAEPASTTTLLQISQWAASVRGKIWSHWHLKIDGVTEYTLFLLCRCLLNSAIITVCIYLKKNTWQKVENTNCFLKLIWSKPKTNKIVHFNQIKCRSDTFCDGFFCLMYSYWTGFEEMTRFWLYPIIHWPRCFRFQLIIIILFGGLLCQVSLIKSCSWSGSRALLVYTVYHLYF